MQTDDLIDAPVAKPWYLSKGVVSCVAGLIMASAPKLLELLGFNIPISEAQANTAALFIIPQLVALYGRIAATKTITGTAGKAEALNFAAVQNERV